MDVEKSDVPLPLESKCTVNVDSHKSKTQAMCDESFKSVWGVLNAEGSAKPNGLFPNSVRTDVEHHKSARRLVLWRYEDK